MLDRRSLLISVVIGLIFTAVPAVAVEVITFDQAVEYGLKSNQQLVKQQEKIANLKQELTAIQAERDWKLILDIDTRAVSDNTETTSQKELASFAGERILKTGLNLTPEIYVKEKEVTEGGWQREDFYFALEVEQPLYPFVAPPLNQDYQETKLELAAEKTELKQLQQEQVVDWLADYLELVQLNQAEKLANKQYQLANRRLEQLKQKRQSKLEQQEEIVDAKLDVNDAVQDRQKAKADYQQLVRELSSKLGLRANQQLKVPAPDNFVEQKLAKLKTELPALNNRQKLHQLAESVSSQLAVNKLERRQIKQELKLQRAESKPEINVNGEYDSADQEWEFGLELEAEFLTKQQKQIAQEELKQNLAVLNRERQSQQQELATDIDQLIAEIKGEQLKLKEERLRLEKEKLELKMEAKELAPDELDTPDYKEQQLKVTSAKLDVKEAKHELLINYYKLKEKVTFK